ncbi:unnamed protein product, partial [Mesorhabditis belari]|uniref:Peptidase A1 domain-containing protein n=1 Tax=Mesorhabditis belari TaxID=2138241 RepID=A0AAF3FG09_9BILA
MLQSPHKPNDVQHPDECSEPVQRRRRRLFSWSKEEPLRNIRNGLWTGDVSVDNIKKPFKINFDTGSTTFWVACDCVNDPKNTCAGHTTILDCKNSPIYMSMATGFWVKDRVCIDHLCTNNEQWIGCANSTTVGTDEAATGDGIMGLAYNDGSMKWSPLQQIFRKPENDEKVFAFYLDSEAENRQDKRKT